MLHFLSLSKNDKIIDKPYTIFNKLIDIETQK